jgi:hypothetical protein
MTREVVRAIGTDVGSRFLRKEQRIVAKEDFRTVASIRVEYADRSDRELLYAVLTEIANLRAELAAERRRYPDPVLGFPVIYPPLPDRTAVEAR